MGNKLRTASRALTDRGLLRAVLLAFALLLAYRFLATVSAVVLLLATGLLLGVALSAPVEWLHRRKVPRPLAVVAIFLVLLGALALAGYLLYPVLAGQARDLAQALPGAISQLADRARALASSFGIQLSGGGGSRLRRSLRWGGGCWAESWGSSPAWRRS